ncbi:MAG: 4'-phosphopantetheinyl transferase superfamily protein [Polaromonas sp.]|nr:4'-phosphopantetheinyl transferase superfamily protein [Polaromonas sp.]
MYTPAVQLWIASPKDFSDADWQDFGELLDPQEQARADGLRRAADRQAYILAHALRRIALAEELNVRPSSLVFASEPGGRPLLLSPFCRRLGFSHAHTQDAVVFALSRDGQIGVDIEAHLAARADFGLLESLMLLPERSEAASGPTGHAASAQSDSEFFLYWTALEAFWKAAGTGLSSANPVVRVDQTKAGLLHMRLPDSAGEPVAPWVIPVAAPAGFSISLAVQDPDAQVFARRITGAALKGQGMSSRTRFLSRAGTVARAASV